MVDNEEPYWKKHLTGIIQCVFGFYCCVFATLAYFFPRPVPSDSSAHNIGATVSTTYSMPVYLWFGIVGLSLSVVIPAIVKMVRGPKQIRQGLRPASRGCDARLGSLGTYRLGVRTLL
jgi:hypothetical protein